MFRTGVRAVVIAIATTITAMPAVADFNGRFPGKGSQSAWDAASKLEQEAFQAEDKHDHKTAESLYRRVVEVYPFDAQSYFNLGLFLNRRNRFKDSELFLRKSVRLEPVFQNWDELGRSLAQQGRFSEAAKAFAHAQRLAKNAHDMEGVKQDEKLLRQADTRRTR